MIGKVIGRHVTLPVTFRLPGKPDLTIEYVVDTGYTDYLTLPYAAVATMGLRFLHRIPADLADDSTVEIDVYRATIIWHGRVIEVPVLATGRRPLLGTALLDKCHVGIPFVEDGVVTVELLFKSGNTTEHPSNTKLVTE